MKLEELIKNWIVDLVSGGLGVAIVIYSFEIKQTNNYWIIVFLTGFIFQLPLIYFQIWKYIEQLFRT